MSFYGCSDKNEQNNSIDTNMVIGRIEGIQDNKVTLAVADMQSMFGGEKPSGDFGGFNGEMPENFNPEDFGGEMPEKGERSENGKMPEGFSPQMGGMMNFDTSSLTFSDEAKEYTIPEGMKIGNGDYTSLNIGDVIMITFDREGGIGEIMVMPRVTSIIRTRPKA